MTALPPAVSASDGPGERTEIRCIHVLRSDEPICPKCRKGLESEGGSVHPAGSYDWGPLYWRCEDCETEWGWA